MIAGYHPDQEAALLKDIDLFLTSLRLQDPAGVTELESGAYSQCSQTKTDGESPSSENAETHYSAGLEYQKKQMWDEAISEFSKAIEINPHYAEAYNSRGIAHDSKDQIDEAIADYSKAIESNPDMAEAYMNRGMDYLKIGEYGKSLQDRAKARELTNTH